MMNKMTRRSAVCIAALLAGGAAQADVTAAEVWENWKAQLLVNGDGTVSIGAEETSGGTVTIRDLVLSVDDPEASFTASFGDLIFSEQGNGTVSVDLVDSYPIAVTTADGAVINITVTQDTLEMLVSGDPEAMNYAITADSYTIALDNVVDGDVTFTGDAQLVMNDLQSTYNVRVGELRDIDYDASVSAVDILVDIQIPGGNGEYITGGGKIDNLVMAGNITMPVDADFDDPDNLFMDGFAVSGSYSSDNAAYVFDVNAEGDSGAGSISTGPTTLSAEFSNETVAYSSNTDDIAVNFSSSDLPFPVEMSVAQYGVGFAMPTAKDVEADVNLSLDFVDLTLNDMVWNLFDPGAVLPRYPATLQFAITGLVKPLFDIMDPAQQAAMDASEMPFEPINLSLDTLRIAAAGALVTGQGAFTFDNSDMQTFAPFPRPEGDVIVEISGLNGLLDKLVSMGLVAQEDIMAPRMMMGMFARSTGDDRMETKMEVTADGRVLANGQQLR